MRHKAKILVLAIVLFGNNYVDAYWSQADNFHSMGDIDWGKRGAADWISPAYNYGSMADSDWGWKKRAIEPFHDRLQGSRQKQADSYTNSWYEPTIAQRQERELGFVPQWKKNFYNYLYKPPVALASVRRKPLDQDMYSFHSMADTHWGWKKKRSGSPFGSGPRAKKHIGSVQPPTV